MAASPEFYKPAAPLPAAAAFSSDAVACAASDSYYYSSSCRTPTGSGISYLKEPTTCPPAPRKPPAPPLCKKRLFQSQPAVISLRLDELERIFRPKPDKRPRGGANAKNKQQQLGLN